MITIRNNHIPFGKFRAVYLFGILFHKGDLSWVTMNHEKIHHEQYKEVTLAVAPLYLVAAFLFSWNLLVFIPLFYYILYVVDWILGIIFTGFNLDRAYRTIIFEREAYANQFNPAYLEERKWLGWLDYLLPRKKK